LYSKGDTSVPEGLQSFNHRTQTFIYWISSFIWKKKKKKSKIEFYYKYALRPIYMIKLFYQKCLIKWNVQYFDVALFFHCLYNYRFVYNYVWLSTKHCLHVKTASVHKKYTKSNWKAQIDMMFCIGNLITISELSTSNDTILHFICDYSCRLTICDCSCRLTICDCSCR
jgi:general stress protein CsbA